MTQSRGLEIAVRRKHEASANRILSAIILLLVATIAPIQLPSACFALDSILVNTKFEGYFVVVDPVTKTQLFDHSIYSTQFNVQTRILSPGPPIVWFGNGGPPPQTVPLLTLSPVKDMDLIPFPNTSYYGNDAPFTIYPKSLFDVDKYICEFGGTQTDINHPYPYPMQSWTYEFVIYNRPPMAAISVMGTRKVGNTITLNAAATDPHGGSNHLHYDWSATNPSGVVANLSNPNAPSPTINLTNKHDIGVWKVTLRACPESVIQGEANGAAG